ncbi:response regulator transcription factor [Acidaminobacter sp. JC074]|uniref:response regulator transcription factor n=1 Tax=Acidaminobacter sp. JC074 TaxID=2530199 RepID=UPI001F0F3E0E|nr:response regulator transcription factor [Acidaminobacter sp. JC074]MCH4887975.1 response regulator transcription factor [Acidaminobacter sp. JC074]
MKAKILLMEDDPGINNLLTMQLKSEGYDVTQAFDGNQATDLFDDSFHLAILDIMVPIKDGFEVLEYIRKTSHIPIIFLTARNEDLDKMRALGLGADDYVTKPFSVVEVVYRCKAHLRRYFQYTPMTDNHVLTVQEITLDKTTCEVVFKGQVINLNAKEYEMLVFFMEHPGQVFTKQQLYEHIWGDDYFGDDNTIMVHISRLREKLGDSPKNSKYIKTIKGLGYRLEKS